MLEMVGNRTIDEETSGVALGFRPTPYLQTLRKRLRDGGLRCNMLPSTVSIVVSFLSVAFLRDPLALDSVLICVER
eukprot:3538352-Amphidinium_carterae.1